MGRFSAKYPNLEQSKKRATKPKTLGLALRKLERANQDNDYLIAKWFERNMEDVKFLAVRDYFAALEQIIKNQPTQSK